MTGQRQPQRAMWTRSLSYSTGNRPLQTSLAAPPKLQPMRALAQNLFAAPLPNAVSYTHLRAHETGAYL
eukprot:7683837-Pyramimonas_sp.AAC.1